MAGAGLYLLFAGLWLYAPQAYSRLLLVTGAAPLEAHPFGDFAAILQAGACWREGVNVYAPSVCMHGGVYNYSPFLLRAAYLPIGLQDQMPGGIILGVLFLAALAWLPPAQSRAELLTRICATCSETVIFALERANFDVVIFLLVMLSVMLLLTNRWAALAGYVVLLFAAAMKFYPAALLALVLRERRRQIFIVSAAIFVCAVGYMLAFSRGTAAAISILPGGMSFRGVFGALNLPFGLVLVHFLPVFTLHPNLAQYLSVVDRPYALAYKTLATGILAFAAIIAAGMAAPRYTQTFKNLGQKQSLLLLAGAITITFCFFIAQNITYRAIFMLLTLPGLWEMANQSGDFARHRILLLICAILFLLWVDFFGDLVGVSAIFLLKPSQQAYPEFAFWLFAQCVWWWVVVQFCAIICCFFRDSAVRV
ncbi:hypothetical protein GCM10010909_14460 [Acidocella aquatica]|uniref:DUF2029 domain-containing protein n=1 Tax=Acidocella aquatica TaxID=1922313 RepID=A0ABQ6A7D3_9PROT|nr:hypothetical protein GCM10010909_14460 [Acidocella aquatica]